MSQSLNLSDLIATLQYRNRDLPPAVIEAAIRRTFAEITNALAQGGRVELRGFGRLEVRQYDALDGRNPRTGAPVAVAAKKAVHWKTGKRLADALNDQAPKPAG